MGLLVSNKWHRNSTPEELLHLVKWLQVMQAVALTASPVVDNTKRNFLQDKLVNLWVQCLGAIHSDLRTTMQELAQVAAQAQPVRALINCS